MSRHKIHAMFVCLFMGLLSVSQVSAQLVWSDWKKIGTETDLIWSIISTRMGKYAVVGCPRGVYAIDIAGKKWYPVPLTVSTAVRSICGFVESKDKKMIAFIGRIGDLTSMVFIGQAIDSAPFYKITQNFTVSGNAQFLALQATPTKTIYCACSNRILQNSELSGSFLSFIPIPGTDNCFGNQKPVCTGLFYSEVMGCLIASGYDSIGGNGVLLKMQNNVMVSFNPQPPQGAELRVSCMTERAGDFNPQYIARLFMVNRDTSGYFFNYSDKTWSLWSFFSVQRGTRQICAMGFPEPTHTLKEGIFTVAVVLANNGVYCSQTYKKDPVAMPIQDCSQQCISLGSLDQFTQLMLVCGTNKGVYCARGEMHFNNTTEDLPSDPVSGFSCSWVRPLNALKVSAKSAGQRASLKMFDAKGVLVFAKENLAFKNNRNLVLPVENSVLPEAGIYSVTMTGAWNSVVYKKKVLIIR